MNSGQKTAVSLVLTAGLFVAFIFTYYTNLFTKIETQFYEPERIQQERVQLSELSDFCDSYIQTLLDDISDGYIKEPSVKSFLSQTPTEGDVTARVQLSGELFSKLPGLDGFRLIDKNGRDIHYSSFSDDVLKQNGTTRVYKNYSEIQKIEGELPFAAVSIPEADEILSSKISFNPAKNFINLSFPVYDKYNIFRGTFVFSFRASDLERELIKAKQISVSDKITLFAAEDNLSGGFLIGMPKVGQDFFAEPVLKNWKSNSPGPDKIIEAEDENYWVILSDYKSKYFSISEAYRSDFFELPAETKYLICVCVFITAFLLLFMLLSLKHDDMVVIRSRIKKIQFALIAEYLENKENVDWQQVSRQIEGRKADLFADVKKSLGHKGKRHAKEVDALLNKSWEEILSALGNKQDFKASISYNDAVASAELKKMLEEVLSSTQLKVQSIQAPAHIAEGMTPVVTPSHAKNVRYFDDVEIPVDEEPIEEVESVEAFEDAESVDEIEPLDEAEPIEEVDVIEEAESLDEVESVEETETFEEEETFDEVEEIEEVESLDEVEQVEEVTSFEESEPVEEVETIEETETEIIEEVEAFDETESVEEIESLDEVTPIEECEPEPIEESTSTEKADYFDEIMSLGESGMLYDGESLQNAELFTEPEPSKEPEPSEESDDVWDAKSLYEAAEIEQAEKDIEEVNEFDEIDLDEYFTSDDSKKESELQKLIYEDAVAPASENGFATVDDVFAERLEFGEAYHEPHKEEDDRIEFEASDPDFGAAEELEPVEGKNMFTMTSFSDSKEYVTELTTANEQEPIIEVNGVFSIAQNIELPKFDIDKNFKKLVDSVLSV